MSNGNVILPEPSTEVSATTQTGQNNHLSQNEIIRKNISAITEVRREEDSRRTLSTRISDLITGFSGSMIFVWLHAVWFGVWILLNIGLLHIPRVSEFDPFPFGLLTMVVSLEAIFLSTFVLISQNRMASLSEQRAELDLHINLLAEQKATKALEMLDQLTAQLNRLRRFDIPQDPEVAALKTSPEPQEVLQVLQEAGKVVEEITGEMEAVRQDVAETKRDSREHVERVEEKIEAVKDDVEEMKSVVEAHEKS